MNGEYVDITGTETNHIGNLNPIRYRGYYFDVDMGLYYLQSRYYDPSVTYFPKLDRIGPAYYFSDLNYLNNIRMK